MNRTGKATVLVSLTAALGVAGTAVVQPVAAEHEDRGLTAAKNISRQYQDEQRAIDRGYTRVDACVQSPAGYMGYHYVNHDLVDTQLSPGRPEALLYKQAPDGSRVLTGIEYLVVDQDQDLATDDDRPTLWGHAFDGPMPGHEPGMPVHYDLHVWAWEGNPSGAWSAWNTGGLSCP